MLQRTRRCELMNQIKKFREKKNLSIHELARRTGLTASYISNLEKGKRDNPSKDTMEKIAEALDKTVPEIFYSED
nr:helix-turn-helix transcriptional regulator [Tepidimicrobium xylanilyticum]